MRLRLDDPTTWPELSDPWALTRPGVLLWSGDDGKVSWQIVHLHHRDSDLDENCDRQWDTSSPLVWEDDACEFSPFPASDGDWWQELPPPPSEEVQP